VGYINDVSGNTYMGMLALAPFCVLCAALIHWGLPDDSKTARRVMV
jgi:hypothetical protein